MPICTHLDQIKVTQLPEAVDGGQECLAQAEVASPAHLPHLRARGLLRDSETGTRRQIRNPHLATQAFYGVAAHTHNPGLVDIPGWQQMPVAAGGAGRPDVRLPSAYAKWEPAARRSSTNSDGSVTVGGDAPGAGSTCCTGRTWKAVLRDNGLDLAAIGEAELDDFQPRPG